MFKIQLKHYTTKSYVIKKKILRLSVILLLITLENLFLYLDRLLL